MTHKTGLKVVTALLLALAASAGTARADTAPAPATTANVSSNATGPAIAAGTKYFNQGDWDRAIASYQQAFSLNPQLYEAALYTAHCYLKKGQFADAASWYDKAIAIDPKRETAYRYSADALLALHHEDEAEKRLIEAYILAPQSAPPRLRLQQWSGHVHGNFAVALPRPPADVRDNNDKPTLVFNQEFFNKHPHEMAQWMLYGVVRMNWRNSQFQQTFPGETGYRHSLAEESDALQTLLDASFKDVSKEPVTASLHNLADNGGGGGKAGRADWSKLQIPPAQASSELRLMKRLRDAGLLDAYVLLSDSDKGISADYTAYRQAHADLLRQYVRDCLLDRDNSWHNL